MPHLLGSHLSIAGSMTNALAEAESLKLDTVQVFTKNQQQWKVKPLDPAATNDWLTELKRLGWQSRTVAHASYLINLASPDDELWQKSIDLMTVELERCEALSIPYLVHHPGAFTTSTEPKGLARIAHAYKELFKRTKGFRTISCLENTVGSGSNLGAPFDQLATLRADIIDKAGDETRVAFCFDTCHAHAAGHDMASRSAAQATLDAFDHHCGLDNLKCLHINDSKKPLASRKDRHEHIGQGFIGGKTTNPDDKAPTFKPNLAQSGFAAVMADPRLQGKPMIMETPKGETEAGTPHDTLNARRLRKLIPA